MRHRTAWISAALLGLLALAPRAVADEPGRSPLAEQVRTLLPEGWVVEAEPFADLERLLPDVHAFFCRLPGRGGYPYERILVRGDGTVLSRADGGAFLGAARAERIRARREGERWVQVEGTHAEVLRLLEVVRVVADAPGRDPGRALSTAVLFLRLLTWQGRFVSATVQAREGGGYDVTVDWRQGSSTWSYEERAAWTFGYDREGALVSLAKARTEFALHLRK